MDLDSKGLTKWVKGDRRFFCPAAHQLSAIDNAHGPIELPSSRRQPSFCCSSHPSKPKFSPENLATPLPTALETDHQAANFLFGLISHRRSPGQCATRSPRGSPLSFRDAQSANCSHDKLS